MNPKLLLLPLTCLLAPLGCQAQQLSIGGGEPLELDDVDEVPVGAAVGTDASGGYLFTDFSIERCECREGSATTFGCNLRWELGADGLWLDQNDGALSATMIRHNELDPAFVLEGGIEADGTFEIGAAFDIVDFDSTVGQGYNLAAGTVHAQESIDARWLIRAQYIDGPDTFDCDIEADLELVWWPLDAQGECTRDADCHVAAPLCVDNVCSAGGEGAACAFPSDCESGVCGSDDRCVDEDACGDLNPCDNGQNCFASACQDGVEGDGCDGPLDCAVGFACVSGGCYDGSAGDPCETPVDCDLSQALDCGPDGACQ
jgi:hypothetical protein